MSKRNRQRRGARRLPDGPLTPGTHTDPRQAGGTFAGPGGPRDRDAVVIDATDAVLLDGTGAVLLALGKDGQLLDQPPAFGISLYGRINKTADRSEVLYLTDLTGAAQLVAEVLGLASRSGHGPAFQTELEAAIEALQAQDALREVVDP